jgi:sugar transferase (PEP-CTERM/EpsH1 system associated)
MRPAILFLCHRLPWPPDKGDKIRSYRVLRRLADHYRVYLGTFIDDPSDWRHLPAVEAVCAGVCVRPLQPWRTRWRALTSLARGEALTVGVYRDRDMRRWVEGVLANQRPEVAVCFSSGVAHFVLPHDRLRRIMDFVDVDSDKWSQYASAHRGLAGMIYRREARCLTNWERAIAEQFDASIFVSEPEAGFFRKQVPTAAGKVHGIPNGVDAEYWDPQRDYSSPYRPGERAVVFVGAMDYRPNVDAVDWFARTVWPRILGQRPEARFYIVGRKPTAAVRALGELPGIVVTGPVEDVRPYVAHAHAVTAPLRIARGIQNKVLEALAMEKVVLATPEAWEGIEDFEGREGCIDGSPGVLAAEALRWLDTPTPAEVAAARAMILQRHDWSRNLDVYEGVLGKAASELVPVNAVGADRLETCS